MKRLDLVQMDTDMIFTEEGIPVSIPIGSQARMWDPHPTMSQVIVYWGHTEEDGTLVRTPEILGCPTDKLTLLESHEEHSCPHC